MADNSAAECGAVVDAVREQAPLVHCLSSAVSMPTVADALLAAGARPMMTATAAESPRVVTGADALLVNLGTLTAEAATAIEPTVQACEDAGLPWVLDPAAIGARTPVRTELAHRLLRAHFPAVVRCNAAEAEVLAGRGAGGSGPDALGDAAGAQRAFAALADSCRGVSLVTGAVDWIGAAELRAAIERGDPLLTRVTGTGCALGALTAACVAVAAPLSGALTAATWMSLAGEWAAARTSLPGSFRVALMDGLAAVSASDVAAAIADDSCRIAATGT